MTDTTLVAERLRQVLHYDPSTGVFRWTCPTRRRIVTGAQAGTLKSDGYRAIRVDGKTYSAHRLAWFYAYGVWPTKYIDHINWERDDNRLVNLREVTGAENNQNMNHPHRESRSGLRGVAAHEGKWQARIVASGKITRLGTFDTPEEAHRAYLTAKTAIHPFWNGV